MMPAHRLPLIFIFAFASAGCAHSAKTYNTTDLAQVAPSTIGLAIPFQGETEAGFVEVDRCYFQVRNVDSGTLYELAFDSASKVAFGEVPAGEYSFRKMGCGPRDFNLTFKEWPNARVYPGKISLAFGVHFLLRNTDLARITIAKRELTRTLTLAFLTGLPQDARSTVVSAYTGEPLAAADLEKPVHLEKDEVGLMADGKTIDRKGPNWPNFYPCFKQEDEVNGLWLGEQPFEAVYEGAELRTLDLPKSFHTYTKEFTECVRRRAKEFHPAATDRLKFKLYL